MKKIAIIGAGLSGITLAKKLSEKADVCIFEKGRGIGGRMSTRYADNFVFDHGAPYWTVKTNAFRNFLAPLMGSVVTEWDGNFITLDNANIGENTISESAYFVATPHMNSLCKHLAIGLNIKTQHEVMSINPTQTKKWHLTSTKDEDIGAYDLVISTAPAPQTLKLFSDYLPKNHGLYNTLFDSCFSMMVGIDRPWDRNWVAANINNSPIKWIGVNSTKPGRNQSVTCLVVHSTPNWTRSNLHTNIQEIQDILLHELQNFITLDVKNISYVSTHRWLYSNVHDINNDGYYLDLDLGLCAVGDWGRISNVEMVWINANKAADFLVSKI